MNPFTPAAHGGFNQPFNGTGLPTMARFGQTNPNPVKQVQPTVAKADTQTMLGKLQQVQGNNPQVLGNKMAMLLGGAKTPAKPKKAVATRLKAGAKAKGPGLSVGKMAAVNEAHLRFWPVRAHGVQKDKEAFARDTRAPRLSRGGITRREKVAFGFSLPTIGAIGGAAAGGFMGQPGHRASSTLRGGLLGVGTGVGSELGAMGGQYVGSKLGPMLSNDPSTLAAIRAMSTLGGLGLGGYLGYQGSQGLLGGGGDGGMQESQDPLEDLKHDKLVTASSSGISNPVFELASRFAKNAAQDNATSKRFTATGESTGLTYKNRADDYAQGQAAWEATSKYFKGGSKIKSEPNPFMGKHASDIVTRYEKLLARRGETDAELSAKLSKDYPHLFKGADAEDALLARMQSKGNMSKSKAVAIAKSRGWVAQRGRHLELTSAGKKPRDNAARHMKQEKQSVDMLPAFRSFALSMLTPSEFQNFEQRVALGARSKRACAVCPRCDGDMFWTPFKTAGDVSQPFLHPRCDSCGHVDFERRGQTKQANAGRGGTALGQGLKLLLGGGAGVGGAALENKYIFGDSIPDEFKKTNLVLGGVTGMGMVNPSTRWMAAGSLPVKQMGLLGGGALAKNIQTQTQLADTNLQAAQANLAAGKAQESAARQMGRGMEGLGQMGDVAAGVRKYTPWALAGVGAGVGAYAATKAVQRLLKGSKASKGPSTPRKRPPKVTLGRPGTYTISLNDDDPTTAQPDTAKAAGELCPCGCGKAWSEVF